MKSDDLLTILVFAPHSEIWVHAFPEALIVESLQQEGHRIIYITCGEAFQSYCLCMGTLQRTSPLEEKKAICERCNRNKEIIKKNFGFDGYDLNEDIGEEERVNVELILQQTTRENFLELKIDGIEVGRAALYEILLEYKKIDLDFSETEWASYLIALKNTLISFFASRRILDKEKPDRILIYNSLYSVNRVCCQLAELRGIPTYFLHAGYNLSNRLGTMLLGAKSTLAFNQNLKNYWSSYKNVPCSHESLKLVTEHFLELFRGRHFLVYSSAKTDTINVRNFFNVQEHQKILVATMSSYDERFAAEMISVTPEYNNLIFPKQIDWIKFLIEFVKYRQDLFLIIRVHPREFPNKRDSVRSQHSQMLENALTDLPINVKLNLPEDKLSIYDLAEYTDLFLNAWSSVGEEMSLFGIPVLIYSPDLVFYPPDINYVATSQADFCEKIDIALADGWSFDRIRATYRWYVLKFVYSTFDISDSLNWNEVKSHKISLFSKFQNYITNFMYRVYRKIKLVIFQSKLDIDYPSKIKDCKQRSAYLKDRTLINELIKGRGNLILDIINTNALPSIDLEVETECIKHEMLRLLINHPDQTNKPRAFTPLYNKMIQLVKG